MVQERPGGAAPIMVLRAGKEITLDLLSTHYSRRGLFHKIVGLRHLRNLSFYRFGSFLLVHWTHSFFVLL